MAASIEPIDARMRHQHAPGVGAFGVLNILIGGYCALTSCGIVLAGSLVSAAGAIGFQGKLESPGALAAAGAGFLAAGVLGLVCHLGLCAAGFGLLGTKPWGRKLSLMAGPGVILCNAALMLLTGYDAQAALICLYAAVLAWMCLSPIWQAAFRPQVRRVLVPVPADAAELSAAA